MAKNKMRKSASKGSTTQKKKKEGKKEFTLNLSFLKDRRFQLNVGLLILFASVYIMAAFVSFIFTGRADQSLVENILTTSLRDSGAEIRNWLGIGGAMVAHLFMYRWFGIASFLFPPLLFVVGFRIVFRRKLIRLDRSTQLAVFIAAWFSLLMGYLLHTTNNINSLGFLSGGIGYELARMLYGLIGNGIVLFLLFTFLAFSILFLNVTSLSAFSSKMKASAGELDVEEDETEENVVSEKESEEEITANTSGKQTKSKRAQQTTDGQEAVHAKEEGGISLEVDEDKQKPRKAEKGEDLNLEVDIPEQEAYTEEESAETKSNKEEEAEEAGPKLDVEEGIEEKQSKQVKHYDPKADLSYYTYPKLELLVEREEQGHKVTREELEGNKDKIVETLSQFKIGISSIKATVGPTVTLYEIVQAAGVRINKIKGLEDDIAQSLAALGIRIIAPIPGRGTIGIEVPNKNREIVSARSVLRTEKFAKSEMELPVVLGKTISNEVYIQDLTKLPHLLIAGATGQGKSVGLNVIISSLLYKKHPSQVKFVLIDPKQVELSIYHKIENHFLAKMINAEEAIITDTNKVVNTLNSLVTEMEARYALVKDGGYRGLKEYNKAFQKGKLDPDDGHRFLPYIVVVIDELADLMYTAGKEVEAPITRLAQKARAIGIHLIVATQRPSVNIITGTIKANFPARLSFRVMAKVDSRTILDTSGAERLIGMGDMLFTTGSDIVRIQGPFIDTEEVRNLCQFISEQQSYGEPYELPEYISDDEKDPLEIDLNERDGMFEDAARVVIMHQQGSTSLIQRKLSLGYNRAGRIMDQLEAAGVVGSFNGSKARDVLIQDEQGLEQLLQDLSLK